MSKFVEPENSNFETMTGYFMFDCPGCGYSHYVNTNKKWGEVIWDFNGDVNRPTVSPSILVNGRKPEGATDLIRCHSFIKEGMIQFLTDCEHSLAGQTVELPEIE